MQLIDRINLNHLRVFEAVFRTRSMTKAAKELHLTQSGISQHVKSLEDSLDIVLFDRFKQKIIPTNVAELLYKRCSFGFAEIEKTLMEITENPGALSGAIKIGLPNEFGNSLLIPVIAKFVKAHPNVQVGMHFGLSTELTELVVQGELDFAYMDEFYKDKRLSSEQVYEDALELCGTQRYLKKFGKPENKKSYYDQLDYVGYLESAPILKSWFSHHLRGNEPKVSPRAYAANPHSVLRLVREDVGVGILPRSTIDAAGKSVKLEIIKGASKPLKSAIHVAYLMGRSHSPAAVELSKVVAESLGVL